jgi:hypothetical protein
MTDVETFEACGCVKVDGFIDETSIAIISQYLENRIKRGEWVETAEGSDPTSKYSCYADPLVEVFLQRSLAAIEEATGKELIPTYSYARVYQPGEKLSPHTDRPSCEISVTVNVASVGEVSPIYTQYGKNNPEKHILKPGDAVVYKGCEVSHWRQPLEEGQLNVQFMLHYVDKNGPNAVYAIDKRPAYGMNMCSRN